MIDANFRFGVVILAAGFSRRMGFPKMLLPWGESSVLGHSLNEWREVGADQIAVVHGAHDAGVVCELDRLAFPLPNRIVNPEPERGMFSSILSAAHWPEWHTGLTHFIFGLGDQPHLRRATLRALTDFARQHPERVCQPSRAGRKRHPVTLPRRVFLELPQTHSTTFKEFLSNKESLCFECQDPGLDLDIDQPEDYEKALVLAGLHPPHQ